MGKRYLEFDGVDDFLVTSSINMTTLPDMTISAGVHKSNNALSGTLLGQYASAVNAIALRVNADGRSVFALSGTGGFNAVFSDISLPAPYTAVVSGHGDISLPTQTIRLNRNLKTTFRATATGPCSSGHTEPPALPLGNYFFRWLYGLVFVTREVEADAMLRIKHHLSQKTGVTRP